MTSAWQKETKKILIKGHYSFHGGIHPDQHKEESNRATIRDLKMAAELILPLYPNKAILKESKPNQPKQNPWQLGDTIKFGEKVTCAEEEFEHFTGSVKTPNLCPSDGIIIERGLMDLGHAAGKQPAIKIKCETTKSRVLFDPIGDWQKESPSALLNRIEAAGIVGLGGAMFPTADKIKYGSDKIKTLIVNAMECEPYITCDDRLMQEQPQAILTGCLITAAICQAEEVIIGIEDNKAKAAQAILNEIDKLEQNNPLEFQPLPKVTVLQVPTKYPSGAEKQLIQLVTGKQVASGFFPASLGILVQNIGTLFAVKQAVVDGIPLTHRLVTITGEGIKNAGNYWIAIGTPISSIVKDLSLSVDSTKGVVIGGPLMGQRLFNLSVPIQASSNCLIFNLPLQEKQPIKECIRCSLCHQVCPVELLPQQIYWLAKSEQLDELPALNLNDCIECRACDYVCPSNIPLVDYFKFAKGKIKQQIQAKEKSDIAKKRFEQREARLNRIKIEREEKRRQAAREREKAIADKEKDPEGKKSAIAAALARVKAKKADIQFDNNEKSHE